MTLVRIGATSALVGGAVVNMWATTQGPSLEIFEITAVANLIMVACVHFAWRRAKRVSAATLIKAAPTIDLILREYDARRAARQDKR